MNERNPSVAGLRSLLSASVHEINNALAPILLYGDLIRETSQEGPTRDKAAAILGQADKILMNLDALRLLYRNPGEDAMAPAHLASRVARLLNPIFRKAGCRARWWVEAGPASTGTPAPEARVRNLIALAEFAQDPPSALAIVWVRRPPGSEILIFPAPEPPSSATPGSVADDASVTVLDPEAVALLLAEQSREPLFRLAWE